MPVPPADIPVEVANVQVAVAEAVNSAPEEDCFALPLLGDEVGVSEEVVKNICVQDWLARKLLTEIVADDPTVLLDFREIEGDGV